MIFFIFQLDFAVDVQKGKIIRHSFNDNRVVTVKAGLNKWII